MYMNRAQVIYRAAVLGHLWMPLKRGYVQIRPEGWLSKQVFADLWFPFAVKAPGFFNNASIREDNIVLSTDSEFWRAAEYVICEDNPDLIPRSTPFVSHYDDRK